MVTAQDVAVKINQVANTTSQAISAATEENYEALGNDIQQLEAAAREAFQSKLEELLWPLLTKLEEGEALAAAEQDMLEMMVVGEAKYYVKSENDVENWTNEVKRLVEAIEALAAAGLDDIDALMRVRALCREAQRVVPDLAFFYREQTRVKKFEAATAVAIDVDARRLLANLVKDMLSSDRM
jgi:hypothetical protein